ncbi:MAG: TonB family protein [Pseudomonadota bacterium]
MIVRIGIAFLVALLAHAGAYAIILVGSPKKAVIDIKGGSISISLMPTNEVGSTEADTDGDDATEQPAEEPLEAPSESAPEPAPNEPLEPDPKPTEPEPQPVPEPEPVLPVEVEPIPEPEPVPEPEELPPEPELETQTDQPEEPAAPSQPSETASTASPETEAPATADQSTKSRASETTDEQTESGPVKESGPSSQETGGGAEVTATELGNAAADNYNGALMRHMRKARKFDTNARRSAKISITIDAGGNILDIKVLRASGDKTWDRRVLKELRRIAPYPAPPSGGTHSWSFDAVPK